MSRTLGILSSMDMLFLEYLIWICFLCFSRKYFRFWPTLGGPGCLKKKNQPLVVSKISEPPCPKQMFLGPDIAQEWIKVLDGCRINDSSGYVLTKYRKRGLITEVLARSRPQNCRDLEYQTRSLSQRIRRFKMPLN